MPLLTAIPKEGGYSTKQSKFYLVPFPYLFDPLTIVSVLWIKGIIVQHLTRKIRTFSTMKETFTLATVSYRTFTMKRMAVRCNTATAPGPFFERAIETMKSASCIDYKFLVTIFLHCEPPL
jgi:hypothetical protein